MRSFFLIFFSFSSLLVAQHTTIDDLHFGDDRNKIQDKLSSSELFTSTLNENLFGRTGLNGVFRSTHKVLDTEYALYFGMEDNELKDLHFRSKEQAPNQYSAKIQDLWEETAKLITHVYGQPVQENEMPKRSEVENDTLLYSHAWEYQGFYILCGVGQENNQYFSVITFTVNEPTIIEQ